MRDASQWPALTAAARSQHRQMMADLVTEVCVVRAPDGVQLRLTHRQSVVEREMAADWQRPTTEAEQEAPAP